MKIFTMDDLKMLRDTPDGPCISFYLPTHRAGADVLQNHIRLKNLLGEAEDALKEAGMRSTNIKSLLKPAQELLKDTLFWQHQLDGLALFIAPEFFQYYRLPIEFQELMVANQHFHLKPLLPLINLSQEFYILTVSKNNVRLLKGTRYNVETVETDGFPTSLAEALKYDDIEKQLQIHPHSIEGSALGKSGIFHGHGGGGTEDQKEHLFRFFRQIDNGLREMITNQRIPLLFMGVDYLYPIYQTANTYPHLMDTALEGNPDELSLVEIHKRAVKLLKPYFKKDEEDALKRYQELSDTDAVSYDIKKVLNGACNGRIAYLFAADAAHEWGVYDPYSDNMELHPEYRPGDEDLLDLAAEQALFHGGKVYIMDAEKIPGNQPLAAVFRY